jgi:hypothetical protein
MSHISDRFRWAESIPFSQCSTDLSLKLRERRNFSEGICAFGSHHCFSTTRFRGFQAD